MFPMAERAAEQVVLELNQGEPISGRIHASSGQSQPFRGWLELATKLERLRTGENATAAVSDPEGGSDGPIVGHDAAPP
jgi:hypothetical protein